MGRTPQWKIDIGDADGALTAQSITAKNKLLPSSGAAVQSVPGIYMGSQDFLLQATTPVTDPAEDDLVFKKNYKHAPVRIPASGVNYSVEKFVLLRFYDALAENSEISEVKLWKNSGDLASQHVRVYVGKRARTGIASGTVYLTKPVSGDFAADPKAGLPSLVDGQPAGSGWLIFAGTDGTDLSEVNSEATAISIGSTGVGTDFAIEGTSQGSGYVDDIVTFVMSVSSSCTTTGNIHSGSPLTIMVQYNEA
jgi:hypothetical protein